jgi:hypothetical protein
MVIFAANLTDVDRNGSKGNVNLSDGSDRSLKNSMAMRGKNR